MMTRNYFIWQRLEKKLRYHFYTPEMALRYRKAINQEGNNTPTLLNLQENNEK